MDKGELWERLVGQNIDAAGRYWLDDKPYEYDGTVLRAPAGASESQSQTAEMFGFMWKQRETFVSKEACRFTRERLTQRYGAPAEHPQLRQDAVVLDAGCGSGRSAIEYFGASLASLR